MALKTENITFDTTDPEGLAAWWARALDGEVNPIAPPFFVVVSRPEGPGLAFQQVEDPTPGKNKVHIDIRTDDDLDDEAARWIEAGATSLGKRSAGDFQWVTLADPDGNEFCIAAG
jgi:hypothetical protein